MVFKKHIILIILICGVIITTVIFWNYYNKEIIISFPDAEQKTEVETEVKTEVETGQEIDLSTKQGLLLALKNSGEQENYQNFAQYLKIAFQKQWNEEEDFNKIESEIYTRVTEKYFDRENIDKALEISTLVYQEVPQGWRFRYLRIRCLEKLGRDAFEKRDLEKAEEFAMRILQMMYRPEGANLLADIYIQRTEESMALKNKILALDNLNYIWDYEISQDRRDKLIELQEQISKN